MEIEDNGQNEEQNSDLQALLAEAEEVEAEEITDSESEDSYQEPDSTDAVARAMVGSGWEFIASSIGAKWPEVTIKQGTKAQAVEALTPVAVKYGLGSGEMPDWLIKLMPEIKAAIFLGGFAFGVYGQIKAAKATEEAAGDGDKRAA